MYKSLARIAAKRQFSHGTYYMIPERSNKGSTWSLRRTRVDQVPRGCSFGSSHATASARYRDTLPVWRISLSPPIYPCREPKWLERGTPQRTLGPTGLPICPVFIPNAWGGYYPIHHPYFRRFSGVRPCGVELVCHCTSTGLAHPQRATSSLNTQLTCPICGVILWQGENKGAMSHEVCIARPAHG